MTDTTTGGPEGIHKAFDRTFAMNSLLAHNWWAVLLRGVAAILFGLVALFLPGATLGALVLVFAVYMLADGVLAIVSAIRAARRGKRWLLFVVEGIVDIVAGLLALMLPRAALLVFVGLAAAWAIISGGLMFASAFRLKGDHGRPWLFVGGAASVIWGALLLLFPAAGLIVMTWWLGAYAFIFGVSLIILGFNLRSHAAEHHTTGAAPTPA